MDDRMMRRPEVEAMTGLSRSTIYELMPRGLFPQSVRIGRRAVAWRLSSIEAWMAEAEGAAA